ncbi:hypothetical protein Tco_1506477 [Tanacetum coccineum]
METIKNSKGLKCPSEQAMCAIEMGGGYDWMIWAEDEVHQAIWLSWHSLTLVSHDKTRDASYFEDITPQSVDDVLLQGQDGNHDDSSFQDDGIDDHQVNTASPQVNTASPQVNTASPQVILKNKALNWKSISILCRFSTTPQLQNTQDHPIDHVFGDVQSFCSKQKEEQLLFLN